MEQAVSAQLPALMAGAGTTLEDEERRRRYAEARAFWEGAQWEGWPRRNETRLTFNYARTLLRKAVSYMFAAPVTFNVLEPQGVAFGRGTEAAQQAERVLARLLSDLDADTLDFGLAEQASVLGDAAVKVTWDADALLPVALA